MSKRLMDMIMSQIGTCSRKGVPQCGFHTFWGGRARAETPGNG